MNKSDLIKKKKNEYQMIIFISQFNFVVYIASFQMIGFSSFVVREILFNLLKIKDYIYLTKSGTRPLLLGKNWV